MQNNKKAQTAKFKRLNNSSLNLVKEIVGDRLTNDHIRNIQELGKRNPVLNDLKIIKSDLIKFKEPRKISPRVYLKHLDHLLELIIVEGAIQKLEETISSLKEKASKTSENNKEKAEEMEENKTHLKLQLILDVAFRNKK